MKRKSPLSERKLARTLQQRAQWGVLPIACLATLLGLPVNAAVTIPGDPLASGVRVAPITIVGDEVFYGTFASQKPRLMKALGLQ